MIIAGTIWLLPAGGPRCEFAWFGLTTLAVFIAPPAHACRGGLLTVAVVRRLHLPERRSSGALSLCLIVVGGQGRLSVPL